MSDQTITTTDAVSTVRVPPQTGQPNVPVQGKVTVAPPPQPVKVTLPTKPAPAPLPPKINVAAKVMSQGADVAVRPKTMVSGNTSNLTDQTFFRCVLYSETSARKTSTAAMFAGQEYTRIITTRGEDQLIPLDGMGFVYEYCPDAASLTYALKYPEKLWPDWAALPDPDHKKTIIVDDLTKALTFLIESNVGNSKDRRQAYTGALNDLDGLLIPLTRKPYNLIWIALAKVKENPFSGEERIGPDMSPSMLSYVTAEFAAVLYIKTKNYQLLTDRDTFSVEGIDEKGKTITYTRELFSKIKVPLLAIKSGLIKKEEPLDLASLWAKIKQARTLAKGTVKK